MKNAIERLVSQLYETPSAVCVVWVEDADKMRQMLGHDPSDLLLFTASRKGLR